VIIVCLGIYEKYNIEANNQHHFSTLQLLTLSNYQTLMREFTV